jgi:gluconokinase
VQSLVSYGSHREPSREGHFFDPDLLPSQIESLEEPEDALVVDAGQDALTIVREIRAGLDKGN